MLDRKNTAIFCNLRTEIPQLEWFLQTLKKSDLRLFPPAQRRVVMSDRKNNAIFAISILKYTNKNGFYKN